MGNRGLSRTIGIGNRSKEFQSIVPFPSNETQQEEKIENARKRKVEEAGRIDDDQVKDVKFSGLGSVPLKANVDFNESEGKIRRDNLAFYESECSQVSKFIFVSGMKVAADYDLLIEKGIKRIINCAPMVVPNFHESTGAFEYLSINLVDGRVEDISWFICQVIHFIKDGVLRGEKVLIHCEKGVSRSCSIAIAHRMWQTGESWKISFDFIKTQRRICSPNTAFTVNLIELTELLNGDASRATLLYRLAYHASYDPDTPVLKLCRNDMNRRILVPATSLLNPKAVFVLRVVKPAPSNHDGNSISSNTNSINNANSLRSQASSHLHDLYVWMGSESTVLAQEAGVQQAKLMLEVFSQAKELRIVKEGEEPTEFLSCLASDGPFQRNSNNGVTIFNDYFGACQPTEAEMQDAATMRFAASSITQEFLRTFAAATQNNNNQASLSSLGADTAPITSTTVSRNNSNAKLNYPLSISAVGGNTYNAIGDDGSNQPMSGIGVSRSRSNTVSSLSNNNTADMVVSIPAALSRANSFSSVDSDGQSILSREERINRIHNIIDVVVNGSNNTNGGNTALSLNLPLGGVSGTNHISSQHSSVSSGSGSGNNRSRHRAKRRSRANDDHNQGNHHGGSQSSAHANVTNSENEQDNSSLDSTGDSPVSFNKRKMDSDTGLERPSDSESSSCGPRVSDSVPSNEANPEQSLSMENTTIVNSAGVDTNNNELSGSGSGMARTSSKPRFVPSIGLYPLAEVRDSASNSAMNTSRPTSAAPSSGSARVVGAGSAKSLSLSLGDIAVGNNSNGLAPSSSRGKLSLGLNLTPAVVSTGAEESPSQQQRVSPSGVLPLSLPTAVNHLNIRSNDRLPGLTLTTISMNQSSVLLQNGDSAINNAAVVPKKTPSKPLLFQVSVCESHENEGIIGQWAAMGVYDDEDLDEQNALLLLCPSRTHYLWIGADSQIQDAFASAMEESENAGDSAHLRQWARQHIANGELDAWDVDWENDTFILENPGNESETFWEKFNEGS